MAPAYRLFAAGNRVSFVSRTATVRRRKDKLPAYLDEGGLALPYGDELSLFQHQAAFFACGNVRLMLSRPEKQESERLGGAIYFKVQDIESAHSDLAGRGVAFEANPHLVARLPDHELWMAFFRDPDRNLLALMCEKRG